MTVSMTFGTGTVSRLLNASGVAGGGAKTEDREALYGDHAWNARTAACSEIGTVSSRSLPYNDPRRF